MPDVNDIISWTVFGDYAGKWLSKKLTKILYYKLQLGYSENPVLNFCSRKLALGCSLANINYFVYVLGVSTLKLHYRPVI